MTLSRARQSRQRTQEARRVFEKLPDARQHLARRVHTDALGLALDAARQEGGIYSGVTSFMVRFAPASAPEADAYTHVETGDAYSRHSKFNRYDATHTVWLDPARVHVLVDSARLRQLSARDGLPLIALDANGKATWVVRKGKQIAVENGWVIGDDVLCFHSTKSREDAVSGHAYKRAKYDRDKAEGEERQRLHRTSPEYKVERRARLMARLCNKLIATVADALAQGYCERGIAAFQQRHGIGDTATLPELVRTGNGPATWLALSLARQAARKAEQPAMTTEQLTETA